MKWIKKGLIFSPNGEFDWMDSYALVPTPLILHDRLRIFFSPRTKKDNNGNFISNLAYIDVDLEDFTQIKGISKKPILELGKNGSFDEFGIMPSDILLKDDNIFLYYTGWKRCNKIPYDWRLGLAVSKINNDKFLKIKPKPVLNSNKKEKHFIGSGRIFKHNGKFHMWYMSGGTYMTTTSKMGFNPVYKIFHATSNDGLRWDRNSKEVISSVYDSECQTCPTVIMLNNKFHMWFAYRKSYDFRNKDGGYKIGYATSEDLINWKRNDDLSGISLSMSGWDSQMICTPYVFVLNNKHYMLYCGNYFGRDGFGYAVLEE
jgi:predicted GH43/DUF377 family glycosyl hydrolase